MKLAMNVVFVTMVTNMDVSIVHRSGGGENPMGTSTLTSTWHSLCM